MTREIVDQILKTEENAGKIISNAKTEAKKIRLATDKEMLALKDEARREMLGKKYDKMIEMFEKELDRVDKAMLKIEDRALKLRALRLEMGS